MCLMATVCRTSPRKTLPIKPPRLLPFWLRTIAKQMPIVSPQKPSRNGTTHLSRPKWTKPNKALFRPHGRDRVDLGARDFLGIWILRFGFSLHPCPSAFICGFISPPPVPDLDAKPSHP